MGATLSNTSKKNWPWPGAVTAASIMQGTISSLEAEIREGNRKARVAIWRHIRHDHLPRWRRLLVEVFGEGHMNLLLLCEEAGWRWWGSSLFFYVIGLAAFAYGGGLTNLAVLLLLWLDVQRAKRQIIVLRAQERLLFP